MVGRDLLVGLAAGGFILAAMHLAQLAAPAGSLPLWVPGTALRGIPGVVYHLVYGLGESIVRAAMLMALLVLLRALLRSTGAAIAGAILLVTLSNVDMAIGPLALRVPLLFAAAVISVVPVFRFGLLSVCSASWVILSLHKVPLMRGVDAWYFGSSTLALAAVTAAALFSFQRSLGGKGLLPGPLLEE